VFLQVLVLSSHFPLGKFSHSVLLLAALYNSAALLEEASAGAVNATVRNQRDNQRDNTLHWSVLPNLPRQNRGKDYRAQFFYGDNEFFQHQVALSSAELRN
jgi:hypothetical protein